MFVGKLKLCGTFRCLEIIEVDQRIHISCGHEVRLNAPTWKRITVYIVYATLEHHDLHEVPAIEILIR